MKRTVQEIQEQLIELRRRWYQKGNFDENTMSDVERRARKAKSLVAGNGYHPEIQAEFDKAIDISQEYHNRHGSIENETIKEALMNFEFGIQLFLDKD